jgi:centrosomal protein CEP19
MSLFSYKSSSSNTNPSLGSTNPTPTAIRESESNRQSQLKFNQYDFAPKRYGLRYDPPTIIVEYLVPSTGKLYHHKMKITELTASSDTDEVIESLRAKHATYFASNTISENQISNLIDKLKKRAGNSTLKPQLDVKTKSLNEIKSADLYAKGNSPALSINSLATTDSYKFTATSKSMNDASNNKKAENGFWDLDDEEEDLDYQTANLNKLTPEEVKKHKDKMDVLFKQNQKKPGDLGFEYDKREEFCPKEQNEWDEEF